MKSHLRPTILLAYPVVLSQLGHILVSVCDSVMVGQTGKLPLAAVSVGVSTTTVLMVLGLGISMGAVPRVAAANGRGDNATLGHLLVGRDLGPIYGPAASSVLVLLFVFYSAMIFYFGAAFTKAYAHHVGLDIKPKKTAVRYRLVNVEE